MNVSHADKLSPMPEKRIKQFICVTVISAVRDLYQGGFPLSRNFYVRTDVNFNWLYVRKLK